MLCFLIVIFVQQDNKDLHYDDSGWELYLKVSIKSDSDTDTDSEEQGQKLEELFNK